MTITIFGATGQVGLQVIQQALTKNYKVKAFGRNVESLIDKDLRNDNFIAIKGYVFDETDVYKAIDGSNAVISCLGGNVDGTDKTRSLGMKNIISQMKKANVKRIVAIGGLGVLNANTEDDTLIMDTEEFDEQYKAVSLEHLAALQMLTESKLDFTFICPPAIINNDVQSSYLTCETYLPTPNNWKISTANLANYMLHCIEKNEHIQSKLGISNE